MRDRNGIEYLFGDSNASREYDPNNTSRIFSWRLSKVTDLNGNVMTFVYTRDVNVLYPQTIDYTANPGQSLSNFGKVEFVYETRSDNSDAKYTTGFLMNTQKRLKQILVKAVDTLQRRYDLAYTSSSQTRRSLLSSVTQTGNTGSGTLPPASFTYQNDQLNYNLISLPGALPATGDNLWEARQAPNYDRGHENYGPVPPYSGGGNGFAGLNWSAVQVSASGSWGGDGSWSTNASGSLTVNIIRDHAYHFSTFVYLNQAATLTVPYDESSSVVGVWINGNYAQHVGHSWALRQGLNLIDVTLYHQHSNGTFNLNFNLASNVQKMVSKAAINAQFTGDFNADSLGDLAKWDTATGKFYVALSSCLNFAPETEWLSGLGSSDKLVLGDYNSDGRTDLLVFRNATSTWDMYFSNGTTFTLQSGWAATFSNYVGQFAAADYNGDGRPDLLAIHTDANNLWVEVGINTGITFNTSQVADYNIGTPSQTFSIGDFNGDGLMDYMIHTKSSGTWQFLFNSGAGGNPTSWPAWTMSNFGAGYDPLTADFDGDGLTDSGFYNYTSGKLRYRPSDGSGMLADVELSPTFNINTIAQVTPVDMNGDSRLDVIISNALTGEDQIAYSASKVPDLLSTASNGIGGQTAIAYGPARVCSGSYLPFPIQVVDSVTLSTTAGDSYTTFYNYLHAVWSVSEREFRGFSKATVTDPDGNYAQSDYLTDDIYKGRISEQRTYDKDGHLFSKTAYTWDKQTIVTGSDFVYLKRKDNYVYDGDATGRRTAEEYTYAESPQYGNLTKALQLGEVDLTTGNDIGSDTRTVETTYVKNTSSSVWILGLPNVTTVKDNSQAVVRKTWFYYDSSSDNNAAPVKGLLTKKTDDGPGASDPSTLYAYDAVGNLTSTTDPLNRATTITYDAAYKLFPLTTANALAHQVVNEYYGINGVSQDSGDGFKGLWGQLKSTTDPNNKAGKKVYDEFGRPVKAVSPLDSVTFPTVTSVYETGSTYSAVTTKQRIKSNQFPTIDTYDVYDGLGRLSFHQTKSITQGVYAVSGQTQYNVRGLPEKQYLPRYTSNPYQSIDPAWTHTTTEYDAMGRVVKVTAPDGTYSSMSYSDWTTAATDANGHKSESDYDAYGRLKTKREYSGADGRLASVYPASAYAVYATTQYVYDSEGNLTQTVDSAGNTTTITYDILGRKTAMSDPDMGAWSYQYDLNGSLTRQTDAKGQIIDFTYDALNRLVNKTDHAGLNVNYTYDDVNTPNSKGRLSYVQYGGASEQTAFQYDSLGRETQSSKTVGTTAYDVLRSYDDLNRVTNIQYPDSQGIYYGYDSAGQIAQVANNASFLNQQNGWDSDTVQLFLNAEGANGSTVFIDSSAAPKSVTANGNAQISTAQVIAGSSSAFFDGTGDYLSVPDAPDWQFGGGTGDFTVDFWIRPATTGAMTYFSQYVDNVNFIRLSYDGTGLFFSARLAGTYTVNVSNPFTVTANAWYHVAVVRSGNSFKMFINGSQIGTTATSSGVIPDLAVPFFIGHSNTAIIAPDFNGYIDDFRVSYGARWTSNFTPPGNYLATKLLLKAEGTNGSTSFIDSSPYSRSVTAAGGAQISTAQSIIGLASGAFNGTTAYLNIADSDDWFFNTGDFTIDLWGRFSSFAAANSIYVEQTNASNKVVFKNASSTTFVFQVVSGGVTKADYVFTVPTMSVNEWKHIALVRSGSNIYLFLNGVAATNTVNTAIGTNAIPDLADFYVGTKPGGGEWFSGWIDEYRVTKGIALWTSNFTPPEDPTATTLFLHAEGANGSTSFPDSSYSPKTVTANGNAQVTTAQYKVGSASAVFDGAGDYLSVPNNADFNLGTANFTIDLWVRPSNASGNGMLIGNANQSQGSSGWGVLMTGGSIYFQGMFASGSWGVSIGGSHGMASNTWNHIAVVRNGSTITIYVNGVSKASGTYSGNITTTNALYIGKDSGSSSYDFNGWMDDVRVTKGVARWTSNFTPPQGQ